MKVAGLHPFATMHKVRLSSTMCLVAAHFPLPATASSQQKLSLPDLIEELGPYAESTCVVMLKESELTMTLETVPHNVREQIQTMLHDFVSRNVEDA